MAAAVARFLGVQKGIRTDVHTAEMWLRNGAVERRFVQSDDDAEELDDFHRVQAFMEETQDGRPIGELLFVGIGGDGDAKTEAKSHRIDALRALQIYLHGRSI